MPASFVYVILYLLMALLCGFFVIHHPAYDALLVPLIIPVVFSALYYSRLIYISLAVIAFGTATWAIVGIGRNISNSMQTNIAISCSIILICEVVRHAVLARKQAETTLSRNADNFRSIIENALDIITTINRDGTIRYVNPSVNRLLGYEPFELKNLSIFDLIHPEHLVAVRELFFQAIRNPNVPITTQVQVRHKNGDWRWIESLGISHLENPDIAGIVVHSRDITERIKACDEKRYLEEELRQTQKIEAVGRLAGGIAHDFNNLLTVITGYGKVLLKALESESPLIPKVQEIIKAGDRGSSLVRQLMAFSRKQMVSPVTVSINLVVKELKGMLDRLIGEHIEFITVLDPHLGMIKADPIQIEQVILNLCINARDAMPKGGKMILKTAMVSLTVEQAQKHIDAKPGDYVHLSVIDTGTGMSEEILDHIFEPFFTTKEEGKGTGLGLATTYGIIKQCQGFILVQSELERGTVFDLYFPVDQEWQPEASSDSPQEAPGGSETVLLVEDDKEVRHLIRDLLQESGYTVLECYHGKEAIRVGKEYPEEIHVLIADIFLPYKNGFEVAQQIGVFRPAMKILYLTGHTGNAMIQNYLSNEETALLNKPFTPDDLLYRLREVLDSPKKVCNR